MSSKVDKDFASFAKDEKDDSGYRLQISSEHRLRSENLPFDIDVWYPIIKDYTFRTYFLPFTRDEAKSIINYYEQRFMNKRKLTHENIKILNHLSNKIQKLLNKTNLNKTGAFVRLCGRSPKDSEPLDRISLIKMYKSKLNNLINKEGFPDTPNTKLISIAKCSSYLCCYTSKDVMSLLLTSERVHTDLYDWLHYGEPEQLVLRQFNNNLTLDYEFRVFVKNNKITAISQYDHYAIYPYLNKLKDNIQKLIIDKFKIINKLISEESYVIDFGYLPNVNQVIVIEISPFRLCTGAACFNWKLDHDLLHGIKLGNDNNIEFRLNTKNHKQLEDIIDVNWYVRWNIDNCDPNQVPNEKMLKYYDYYKVYESYDKKSILFGIFASITVILLSILIYYYLTINNIINIKINQLNILNNITNVILDFLYYDLNLNIQSFVFFFICLSLVLGGGFYFVYYIMLESIEYKYPYLLFVYGTLKRNFHWNQKYMSYSKYLFDAVTVYKYPLVNGDCNVPYLIIFDNMLKNNNNKFGYNIKGELWRVNKETLYNLDQYEGCNKGYYKRNLIKVREYPLKQYKNYKNKRAFKTYSAYVYYLDDTLEYTKLLFEQSLKNNKFVNEYSLEYHKKYYKPIKHIQVKQLQYLGEKDDSRN